MKKPLVLISCMLVSALLFTGCGKTATTKPTGTPGSQPAAQPQKKIEIAVAMHSQSNTTEHLAVMKFKKEVEEKTNGQIVVNVFPDSKLGSEKENMEDIMKGKIQMSIHGSLVTNNLTPELDPTNVPFVYPSIEAYYKTWDGPLGDRIKKALAEKGNMIILAQERRGPRNLTANKKITKPEDVNGLVLRLTEDPAWVVVWKGLGVKPVPKPYSEIYNSIKTGAVDAQENPYENIYFCKLQEVQKYVMKTEHLYSTFKWVIAKNFFESLSPEHQKIVQDAATTYAKWGDETANKADQEYLQKLKDAGMEVVEVDKAAFKKAALPAIKEYAKNWAPGVWDEVKGYLE